MLYRYPIQLADLTPCKAAGYKRGFMADQLSLGLTIQP
jgi:hypothetical protein